MWVGEGMRWLSLQEVGLDNTNRYIYDFLIRQMITSWVFVACMHFALELELHLVHWCCLVLALANYPNCINLTKNYPKQKSQSKCGKKISPIFFSRI
jgi:hypothetical protein